MTIFDSAYESRSPVFGETPTACVVELEKKLRPESRIVDLGCGDGRDSLFLARHGHFVDCVDLSAAGISALNRRAKLLDLDGLVNGINIDVLLWCAERNYYDAAIGITVLDHLSINEHDTLFERIRDVLKPEGFVAFEMHSDRDPGSRVGPEVRSEFSGAIRCYAEPNYLARKLLHGWRILSYSDRMEEDNDHGPAHLHGFVTVIAEKMEAI